MKINISSLKQSKVAGISFLQIVLGCSALILLILIVPQSMNMSKVLMETNEKRKILSDLDQGIENFNALELEFTALDKAYRDFLRRAPLQKEFPVFLEVLSSLARKNGVKIIAMEPRKFIDNPALFFIEIPVLIDAYAGYHELGKFIHDVECSDKLMKLDKIRISQADLEAGQQQVFISVLAYCLKDFPNETNL